MEAQIKLGRIFGIEIGQRHEAPEQIRTVGPDSSVVEALQRMGREGVNQLPVVSGGRLEGTISRGHVLQLLQMRAQLNM